MEISDGQVNGFINFSVYSGNNGSRTHDLWVNGVITTASHGGGTPKRRPAFFLAWKNPRQDAKVAKVAKSANFLAVLDPPCSILVFVFLALLAALASWRDSSVG